MTDTTWKINDQPSEENKANSSKSHVRFGDQPNQVLPAEWAEKFLRIVYTEHPAVFRAILPRLYELPEPEKRSRGTR